MKNYEIYYVENLDTHERNDGPDWVYRDYETIENAFRDLISDFAAYWCDSDLDLVDVDYDYDEKCAICTFTNIFTNKEDVWLVKIREIEEEIL